MTGLPSWRVPYKWRDAARLSPQRIEELAAHDAHIRELERRARGEAAEAEPAPWRERPRSRYDRVRRCPPAFAALREVGVSVPGAARQLGITEQSARAYEKRRLAEQEAR